MNYYIFTNNEKIEFSFFIIRGVKKYKSMIRINQKNLCEFAENGELDNLKYICSFLDENGKNEEYNLDIAGNNPAYIWDNYSNYTICRACANGHLPIVVYLMENWSHVVDITTRDNYAIRNACSNGHLPILVYLMENWQYLVDITAQENYAIRFACFNGHLPIVVYLIECNYPVDITMCKNFAIFFAYYREHIEIVKYLISSRLKIILDKGLELDFISWLIKLLEGENEIIELIMFINELKKRNIQISISSYQTKKIEKAIKYKNAVCIQLEHHPRLPYGQKGIKYEDGLNEVKKLLNW